MKKSLRAFQHDPVRVSSMRLPGPAALIDKDVRPAPKAGEAVEARAPAADSRQVLQFR